MTHRHIHRLSTFALSLLMALIGVVLIVQAAGGHAGVFSSRLLLGVLFVTAGAGRGYIETKRGRGEKSSSAP